MTQEFLQDAIVADLADLFEGQTLPSSAGDRRRAGGENRPAGPPHS